MCALRITQTDNGRDQEPGFDISDDVGADEWQGIADQCDYATFFHTPAWYTAFSETYPYYKIATKKFIFTDGKVALFPLLGRRTPRGSQYSYLSGPGGCYGGWISANDLHREHAVAIGNWILSNLKKLTWRLNPLDNNMSVLDQYSTTNDTTEILHLQNFRNEEELRNAYKRSVRKEINKALKADLSVKQASTWDEWENYYSIYLDALDRWGDSASSTYPIDLFKTLFDQNNSNIQLWLVFHQNKLIGGNLNFYHNSHCVEWHAAFDSNFFGSGARNFLVDRIIAHALDQGYGFYDFNPSGGHEGPRKFKQAFGTLQMPSNVITIDKAPHIVKLYRAFKTLIR